MKKTIVKIATAIMCACMAVVPLVGCGEVTAYDLAVQNGFTGTEAEWLESLKGESAYDLAVKNGFTGTEAEWLASLKGKDGLDSDDNAYDIAVKNGFTGAQKEWLESLKGAEGKAGTDAVDYLYKQWEEWVENGIYSGTYYEFLTTYDAAASAYGTDNGVAAVSKALCSSVIVFGEFTAKEAIGRQNGFGSIIYGTHTTVGAGAGAIYQYDEETGTAYIVTNYHVVFSADSESGYATKLGVCLYGDYPTIESAKNATYSSLTDTTLKEGTFVEATFIGGSASHDVAVLKVDFSGEKDTHSIAAAKTVDSDFLSLGQKAIAIGNPSGSGFSATTGTLSVDSENILMESITNSSESAYYRVMRVDTAINAGNSGGGLYDASGNLIGLVNAKTASSSIDNISYAIPANIVRGVADNVIRHSLAGKNSANAYAKRTIGIATSASDSSNKYDAQKGTITLTETVCVTEVQENSAASVAGLAVGDIIRSAQLFNSESVAKEVRGSTKPLAVTRNFQLSDYMLYAEEGDKLELTIVRDGAEQTVTLTV